MALRNLTSVVYTDDQGNEYAMKMDASVFAQQNAAANAPLVGGRDLTPADAALAPMPTNLKPRHVIVSVTGNRRRVICLTPTSDLFLGTAGNTSVTLPVLGEAAVAYGRSRKVNEEYKRRGDPAD